jgi:hypothetical protein
MSFHSTTECPELIDDVLAEVFLMLPLETMRDVCLTCTSWKRVARSNIIWIRPCRRALTGLSEQIHLVISLLDIVSRRAFSEKSAYERLEFLRATVTLLQGYVSEQLERGTWGQTSDLWHYAQLIGKITKQMRITASMLGDLNSGSFAITVNFDIFDLALRKYYEEVSVMVPIVGSSSLASIIHDLEALACWCEIFGNHKRVVHYEIFYERFIRRYWSETAQNERFERYMAHYFNFPRDDFFSAYRFNVLVTLFGPFRSVATNFIKFVLCPGFVGLINMIKAEEILLQLLPQLRRSTVLIRFSRRQPELLAFTSIDVRTGKVEHRRNINAQGHFVPIAQYLARAFPGYELIRMGVDDTATQCDTTFTFARYNNPYMYSEYPERSSGINNN